MANEQETGVQQNARGNGGPAQGEQQELFPGLSQIDPQQALSAVTDFARQNPHAALGAGVAVGFLLGGGLTPRLIGAIGLFAARRYFRQTVNQTLEAVLHEELLNRTGAR